MLSNMLLFVLLCYQIEEKYGWWRAVFIFVWSAVGGEKHDLLGDYLQADSSQQRATGFCLVGFKVEQHSLLRRDPLLQTTPLLQTSGGPVMIFVWLVVGVNSTVCWGWSLLLHGTWLLGVGRWRS